MPIVRFPARCPDATTWPPGIEGRYHPTIPRARITITGWPAGGRWLVAGTLSTRAAPRSPRPASAGRPAPQARHRH